MITSKTTTLLAAALLVAAGSANAQSGIGGGGEPPAGPHLMAGTCLSLARLLDCSASDIWSALFRSPTTARAAEASDTVGSVNDGPGSRPASAHRASGPSASGAAGGR